MNIFQVFIRELISNASDALEKLRYFQLTGASEGEQTTQVLEIKITTDRMNKTITVQVGTQHTFRRFLESEVAVLQDTGIGMTKEELIENLGTIARSGSKVSQHSLNVGHNIETNCFYRRSWNSCNAIRKADPR